MASTILVNTINTQSGTTITIPTGKTLAVTDAGALTIGGTAITVGAHATATSSANPTTITSGNVTGKSDYTLSFDASSGTSTTFVVNLPAPADFATTVITVKANGALGTGNKIEIRNSGGTEVYTLYYKGDYCTFVSDGTNTIRNGAEFATVRGRVALTANASIPGNTYADPFDIASSSNYTVVEEYGGGWNTSTDEWVVPHTGVYWFGGHMVSQYYITGFLLYKDGSAITTHDGTTTPYGYAIQSSLRFHLTAGEAITWFVVNTEGTANPVMGAAGLNRTQCQWSLIRRD